MRPPFMNRRHAGQVLAQELALQEYPERSGRRADLVLALPRGGVPVGFEVAVGLGVPLDVFVVRKLGVPSQPELAMGALASGGGRVLNEPVVRRLGITREVLEEVTQVEMQELLRRESTYRGKLAPLDPSGARVILVDDGLATGSTMRAAVEGVRSRAPAGIIVAVPVAPAQVARRLREAADEVICPIETDDFLAVGQWYEDFSQTSDQTVKNLLLQARTTDGDRLVL